MPDFEKMVAGYAVELLEELYKSYPTTIEQDEKILKRNDISSRLRFAVILRLGNKRILRIHI